MPRFKSEEGRQRWLAAMAARRGQKQGTRTAAMQPDGSVALRGSRAGGGIQGAIEEIESKIAALEQVKRNLLQAQELVNQ